MVAYTLKRDLLTDRWEARFFFRIVMEPRWRKFRYKKPIVAAATGVHGERLFVPGSDESLVWQRASGPVVDFSDDRSALVVPLPDGPSTRIGSIRIRFFLQLITSWKRVELPVPVMNRRATLRRDSVSYTLDRVELPKLDKVFPGDASLCVKLLVQREDDLGFDDLEFAIDKDGKTVGWLRPMTVIGDPEETEYTLRGGFNTAPPPPAPWTLVIRKPEATRNGHLDFTFKEFDLR